MGANLRRIEAVTSFDALAYMNRVEAELKEAAESLRVPLFDVSERTASNMKTLKDLQTKLKRGREAVADDGINALLETAQTSAAGYPVVFGRMPEADAGQMRNMWDVLRARLGQPGAAVLATAPGLPVYLAGIYLVSIACGIGNGVVFKLVPAYFTKQAGIANGIVAMMGGLGGFFPPLVLSASTLLFSTSVPGFAAFGAFALACLAISLVMRRKTRSS